MRVSPHRLMGPHPPPPAWPVTHAAAAASLCAVLGRFLHSLNAFCEEEYGQSYEVHDYHVYDFAKVPAWEEWLPGASAAAAGGGGLSKTDKKHNLGADLIKDGCRRRQQRSSRVLGALALHPRLQPSALG